MTQNSEAPFPISPQLLGTWGRLHTLATEGPSAHPTQGSLPGGFSRSGGTLPLTNHGEHHTPFLSPRSDVRFKPDDLFCVNISVAL